MLRLSGNQKGVKEMNARLARVDKKFKQLFEPEKVEETLPEKLTEVELLTLLIRGNGLYWHFNGEKITPRSTEQVVESLQEKAQKDLSDIFYDFNRLREAA